MPGEFLLLLLRAGDGGDPPAANVRAHLWVERRRQHPVPGHLRRLPGDPICLCVLMGGAAGEEDRREVHKVFSSNLNVAKKYWSLAQMLHNIRLGQQ